MKIQNISQPTTFKSLQYTERLKTIITNEKAPAKLLKKLGNIKDVVTLTNSHKKKYVDVILDCDDYGQFSAAISSKKQGIPYHPDSTYYFSEKSNSCSKFSKWVNAWNYDYSPKGIENFDKLKKLAIENIIKHKQEKEKMDYLIY